MIRRYLLSAGVALAVLCMALSSGTVNAQTNNSRQNTTTGNGLRISPVRNDLTIKPGSSQTVDLYVTNITNLPTKLKGVINDFIASEDESGKPRILLDENTSAPSHGLRQYVTKIENFTLQPQEQRIIKVKIAMPSDAAGGGYFGAVRFLPENVDESLNVSLTASVGSLFLVTVPGDIKEQAGVESFNVTRGENGKASNFFTNGSGLRSVARIKNTGNVQVQPFGKVVLKKGSKVLGTYEVNNIQPRGSVLPDSIRRFNVDFGDKAKTLGKYTVEGNFGYGATGQLISAKTSFFVVPLPILITLIICLLLIIAAVFIGPRMLKSHDRKLLRKVRRKS